ncbi:MAG: glutamine amidotransferase [Proteobacteria bacterium]|nr:glutamine amidotransferase [Pseudomonadota bacterium]
MSKPFLIIQLRPEDETADNEFESIKFYGGLRDDEVIRLRAEKTGLADINLDEIGAIIVGGSPFNVSTPSAEKSDIQRQIESGFQKLFANIVDRDFPFLGCCSGSGLLGRYCGANISTKYGEPVGGVDVALTEAGKQDPLLAGFPDSFRVLCGHQEACDSVPPGTVLLATNASSPVQMFRLKRNIYATQFHPEGDAKGFIVRIHIYKDHGYFPPESAQELIEAVENEHTPEAQLILKRFVDIYRDQSG